LPRSPEARMDFKDAEGTMPEGRRPEDKVECPRGAMTTEPKVEKVKKRKLKKKVKTENKDMRFHRKY